MPSLSSTIFRRSGMSRTASLSSWATAILIWQTYAGIVQTLTLKSQETNTNKLPACRRGTTPNQSCIGTCAHKFVSFEAQNCLLQIFPLRPVPPDHLEKHQKTSIIIGEPLLKLPFLMAITLVCHSHCTPSLVEDINDQSLSKARIHQ